MYTSSQDRSPKGTYLGTPRETTINKLSTFSKEYNCKGLSNTFVFDYLVFMSSLHVTMNMLSVCDSDCPFNAWQCSYLSLATLSANQYLSIESWATRVTSVLSELGSYS